MKSDINEARGVVGPDLEANSSYADNRRMTIGFITLIAVAGAALIVRNLFQDLNPLIVAGLGASTYAVYIGALIFVQLNGHREQVAKAELVKAQRYPKSTTEERE